MNRVEAEELTKAIVDSEIANPKTMYGGEGRVFIFCFLDWLYDLGFEINTKKEK